MKLPIIYEHHGNIKFSLVYFQRAMNKYLRLLTLKIKGYRTHSKSNKLHGNYKKRIGKSFSHKDLLSSSKRINNIIMQKLKSYSNSIDDSLENDKNTKIRRLHYEIAKAELAVKKAYQEFQYVEKEVEEIQSMLYYELGIEDDYTLFDISFLRKYSLTKHLYDNILIYNNKRIEQLVSYKKYIEALDNYEYLLEDYTILTEGRKAIDYRRRDIKLTYREAEIQYADATVELRLYLNKLLEAIKQLLYAENKFEAIRSRFERIKIEDEYSKDLKIKLQETFAEYYKKLENYDLVRRGLDIKVNKYLEAKRIHNKMLEKYGDEMINIMAN